MLSLDSVLLVLTEKIVMFTAGPLPSPSPPLLLMLLVWNKMKESDRKAWGNLLLTFLAQLSSDSKPGIPGDFALSEAMPRMPMKDSNTLFHGSPA